MKAFRPLVPLVAGVLLLSAADASEPAEHLLAAPGSEAWRPLVFPRIDEQTRYERTESEGREAVRSDSRCSASALVVPIEDLELASTPELVWSWKVDRPLAVSGSERRKSGDDFAARVYVAFRFDPAEASTWERLKRRAAETVYGAELPGNTLNYVWSRAEPAGESWANPFTSRAQMLSRGSGELDDWREERADVLADYRRAFGGDPTQLLFVGIMTDSDNSCSAAAASFAGFRFTAPGNPDPPLASQAQSTEQSTKESTREMR